ncbi:hypothetical protein GA0061098_1013173 [Bradyrhizobium shewense]|uniref:Uncharacterized protein n=1 Tax=Bradyrhizobium shewense TaxID=1761772 RepID=A0A1C3XAJ5_9BRAD|nr:hypothetical protein GA0061098_1013173 [Bradyrhizobium shewense]
MPGLVPGIHVLCAASKIVDGRDEPGHDGRTWPIHSFPATCLNQHGNMPILLIKGRLSGP